MIKGLENIVSIVGKNGEVRQGFLEKILNPDGSYKGEFWFADGLTGASRIWCKEDYWTIKGGISFGTITVQ